MVEVPYMCTICKGELQPSGEELRCAACDLSFQSKGGIFDFTALPADASVIKESSLKRAYSAFFNLIAPIYESWIWYQLTLNLSGAGDSSIASIARFVGEVLGDTSGSILDVACGTATYGRRIASSSRKSTASIIIWNAKAGLVFLAREGIDNVFLARATVERLPFGDAAFDGAICCGSLHLFPDPLIALREIARTLKAKAPLALQTFLTGRKDGANTLNDKIGYHKYEAEELRGRLEAAGFGEIGIKEVGTVLLAKARKIDGIR